MKPKIGFIGATGMLGLPVLKELVNENFEVTAFCRNILKAKLIFPPRVNIAQGNLEDKNSLIKFCSTVDVLYLNLSIRPEDKQENFLALREGILNILDAAKRNKIKKIAFLSSLVMNYQGKNHFTWWVFQINKEAINYIKNSGISYSIFYPSSFMENFFNTQKMGNKILILGESKQKMFYIAGEDYGRMVAASFEKNINENKEFVIQGIESFTILEAAKITVETYKKENLKIFKVSIGFFKLLGIFVPKFLYISKIYEALNNFPEKFYNESQTAWNELGKPRVKLKEFILKKNQE